MLQPGEIAERIEALRPALTPTQAFRLTTIKDLVDDGRFLLRAALEAGDFPSDDSNAQDAFQDFRHKVNRAAERVGVDLRLELDARKTSPDTRHGWFAGNPAEKGLVDYTAKLSGRTGVTQAIASEVAEIGDSRRIRVYVSFSPTTGSTMRRAGEIVRQISEALRAQSGYCFEVASSRSTALGEDAGQALDRLSAEADVRVALISAEYLNSGDERRRGLASPDNVLAFALSALPVGDLDLAPLRRHDVSRLEKPWDHLKNPSQRAEYIHEIVRQTLITASRPYPGTGTGNEGEGSVLLTYMAERLHHRRQGESRHLVQSEAAETTLQESRLDVAGGPAGPPLRAVDRLIAWATDDSAGARRLCALLGDVGMGKTTTAKLFTQRLLDLHRQDAGVPMPVLFDLRDVRVTGLTEAMTLDHILDSALDATRPAGIPRDRLNSGTVRKLLARGDAVIVFDGLDEVLVHLTPHDRQLFTRQLWRVIVEDATTRMLLTCRTQYFRTIRDEITYFTGESRQGLRGDDYLALLMLPFREEQIRAYLVGNLDRDESAVDRFLETIAAVHDLPDLARRPITLRLIADQVEFIESAKLKGRTLRSVDIYSEVVDRWLARDQGKHTLTPDHKRLLMEEIAAGLWRSGQNAWTPGEVDDWLLAVLDKRPELRRYYRNHLPELWTADFRTATFLKREGDNFQFGHRSLFEYFLAQYLLHNLSSSEVDFEALDLPIPNTETLEFLGQSIASTSERERAAALASLRRIGRERRAGVSELALAYALNAHRRGYPHQSLDGVRLGGARLSSWQFGGEDRPLSMIGADFSAANLRKATFHNVALSEADFAEADLSSAEFHESNLTNSRWDSANATGTIMRRCSIGGIDFDGVKLHRTQLLFCLPSLAPRTGLLIAPAFRAIDQNPVRLNRFTGNTVSHAVAWSPDGTHIATGGFEYQSRVWIWDAETGQQIRHLPHDQPVTSLAWSPDNTHIATGGNSARIWNAETGQQIRHLPHDQPVTSLAWSPDNTHIATGGNSARIWNAETGQQIRHLPHDQPVTSLAWSPDNTHIATSTGAGDDIPAVRIWAAGTGREIRRFRHLEPVTSTAWSPDGIHIAATDDTGVTDVRHAATGEEVLLLMGEGSPVDATIWSPDGTRILTCSDTISIWNAGTGNLMINLSANRGLARTISWSPDGSRILTGGGADGTARVWDATTYRQLLELTTHGGWVSSATWSPDGTRILTGGGDNYDAWVWDAETGAQSHHLTELGWASATVWSPDSTRMLTCSPEDLVRVWDAGTGEQKFEIDIPTERIFTADWSPDGASIITAGNSRDGHSEKTTLRVFDSATGTLTRNVTELTGSVNSVAWSPDGKHIVVSVTNDTDDDSVQIWNVDTVEQTFRLTVGDDVAVAWSPDGTRILVSGDGVQIRNASTGELILVLDEESESVTAVAWSPDGTRILTGTSGTVRVWDAVTGEPSPQIIAYLTAKDVAVLDTKANKILGCTPDSWRWLGWNVLENGRIDRLPAETFGELPPLSTT
ncbi:eIF2A-related protein [Amycolatopsis sp. MEPSY49]|uniref:WD40 domain-containing protein n=1 Tax=Amycolatopsis sp. MEPSY49 TaxID=3151600 RepID=UPI003EF75DE8